MSKRFKEIMPSLIAVLIALLVGGIIMILNTQTWQNLHFIRLHQDHLS